MCELKTKKTDSNVYEFIDAIEDERKRDDSRALIAIIKEITGEEAKLWGTSIVAFCDYRYKYASGREGDWFKIGFAPRKQNLTLYIMSGFAGFDELLAKLGKHKLGKGCLYIKSLDVVDIDVLKEIIKLSIESIDKNDALLCGNLK